MENNKVINQDPPTEEVTEEKTETTEEVGEVEEETVLNAESLIQDVTQLKSDMKTLMNSMNYLIDITKNNKKGSTRLVIKNEAPKQKTNKEMLFELFPPTQEYIN